MNPHRLMRPDLLDLPPFGESPPLADLARQLGHPVVKLDANENPYGPSPAVAAALAGACLERYPDPESWELRKKLGHYLDVEPDRIVCSAGGDEMLDLLLRLFLEPGDEVINCTPSFVMYPYVTAYNHGTLVRVPRDADFVVDVNAVERALTNRTKVIFLCSPNNPTGNSTPRDDIIRLLQSGKIVVLDEAYAEFAGRTHVDLTHDYPNLVVLRTMSKWAALAAVRLAYAVVDPAVTTEMAKITSPFHVGAPAQVAGIASLQDAGYLLANVRRIVTERERLRERLQALPFGAVFPSETSFLFWTTGTVSSRALQEALLRRGVLVRAFHDPIDALRISIGLPEESDLLLARLEETYADLAG